MNTSWPVDPPETRKLRAVRPVLSGMRCELCERPGPGLTVHHLTLREHDGHDGPKTELCSGCHRQVHALFSNRALADELNSLEKLRFHPRMARYLRWARQQDS